jgi:serine/threonine protein phosphatase PrpC
LANKQLHLDVAQLTDVGKKREHNEDNMAYVIPKDVQVMARKGALFIVADGMGGHAAGEVASEIAVDTVTKAYYQEDGDDVAASLLIAIKRANALIHQRAAENTLRSGMGTTCVAAVFRGSMIYIANVGDSRAYLVRNGQVRQISQDHSWVAEQVRAGLLTEDQARTHAQRNVITRCLGTQADVEVDVFPELLEEGDAFVLCTDGLSGQVSDDEIRRTVDQTIPQKSVYALVEKANANGGPDNITAIVIGVQEVGLEPPIVRHPVPVGYAGSFDTGEDTAILGLASVPFSVSPRYEEGRIPSDPLPTISGSLNPADIPTAPQPLVASVNRQGRSRLFFPTLALVILVIMTLAGGSAYIYLHGNSGANIDQKVQQAQSLIAQADQDDQDSSLHPALALQALQELANAQALLRNVEKGSLSTRQQTKVMSLFQGNFTTDVRRAIATYNTQMLVTAIPCPSTQLVQQNVQLQALVPAQVGTKTSLYALGADNQVYFVNTANTLTLVKMEFPSYVKINGIAPDGPYLAVLSSQVNTTSSATASTVALFAVGQSKPVASIPIDPTLTKGMMPNLITANGLDIYVVLLPGTGSSKASILDYTLAKAGKSFATPKTSTFSVSDTIISVAAFPNQQLYLLLQGGSVQALQFAGGSQETTPVLVQRSVGQPVTVSPTNFTWKMDVPVPTTGTTFLELSGASQSSVLVAGMIGDSPHLYIMDTVSPRILNLTLANTAGSANGATPTASATIPTASTGGGSVTSSSLQLQGQYISPTLFNQMKSIAVDPQGKVYVLAQNTPSVQNLTPFNSSSQTSCG